jgi:membrane protein
MAGRMALWRKVAVETFAQWDAHKAWTHSAALAFYTLFSLAPVLIVVVSLSGAVFGQELVRGQVVREFQQVMGHETGRAVQGILETAAKTVTGGLAGTVGLVTLLFGATAVFIELQVALNVVWEVAPKPGHLLKRLLIKRLLSFALVIAIGFLLLVSLTLSAALSALQNYMKTRMGAPVLLDAINALFTFAVFSILFALIYRVLPDVEIPWRDVWLGSLVTAGLFSLGKWLIGLYLGHNQIASAYGAAGSVVIILLWVYYTALIVLLGAEFTRVYSRHFFGSRRRAEPGAERVHTEEVPGRDPEPAK